MIMKNVLRALIFDEQVSLTLANTTDIVNEAKRLHFLSPQATIVLGKALSAMIFMSACLKEKTGEISLSAQSDGLGGGMGISGNQALYLRGYIENPNAVGSEEELLGENGAITIIRDDGYNRPFVGACAFPKKGGVDGAFEEYFRISEQLPTYIKTTVELNENGECVFAGVAALQPLPFADEKTLERVQTAPLERVLEQVKTQGVEQAAKDCFQGERAALQLRKAEYRCNCSREYLKRVLVTLGKAQAQKIEQEDGAIKVHCHYCNSNYEFNEEDVNNLFN
jgi:molecular chaperone Hsp33